MAISIGTSVPNLIMLHNTTHAQSHGSAYVHNDGPDVNIDGVSELPTVSPTTLAQACDFYNSAKALFNSHIGRWSGDKVLAHKAVDGANAIATADMSLGSSYESTILAALAALVGELQVDYINHISNKKPDGTASGVHAAADTTYILGATPTLSSFSIIAEALNNLKAQFNGHIAFSSGGSPHPNPDGTNAISTANADANNIDTLIELANAIRTKYTAHLTQATVHTVDDTFNTVAASAVSYPADLFTLAGAYKTAHNAHAGSTSYHNSADATNQLAYSTPTTVTTLIAAAAETYTKLRGHLLAAPLSSAAKA